MRAEHDHQFHFTREPDVLAMTGLMLDWPDYIPERIISVDMCSCGEVKDIEWTAGSSRGSIPGWMARRFRVYFNREAGRGMTSTAGRR